MRKLLQSAAILAAMAAFSLPTLLEAQENAPAGSYVFGTLAIGAGPNSYVDKFAGSDMLPYTSDDITLAGSGNYGGSWGFAHFDTDSDKVVDDEEHILTVVRVNLEDDTNCEDGGLPLGDDDILELASQSRPEYGVLYESEDWQEYRDFRLDGPQGNDISGACFSFLTDFETNDRKGWCGESNAYVYNNLSANQHGDGKSKYYFENGELSPGGYDEIEGWRKSLTFRNIVDDPDTSTFNERGSCRDWLVSRMHLTRGYLIPVADLAGLQTGSLLTLFGWEGNLDLASYLRDTIAPKLSDDDLYLYHDGIDPEQRLPITHVMLRQVEVAYEPNESDTDCSGPCEGEDPQPPDPGVCQVNKMAAYWGLMPSGSTYRASHLLGFKDDTSDLLFPCPLPPDPCPVRRFNTVPEDGSMRNLWVYDHFLRDDESNLGRYTFEPPETGWSLIGEPNGAFIDYTFDKILVSNGAGAVSAPLPRALQQTELPIEVVADLAEDLTPPPPPAGGGAGILPATFQIILRNGTSVIAYADISSAATVVHLGGTYVEATGIATAPAASGVGGPAAIGAIDSTAAVAEYTRFILRLTCDGVSLRQISSIDAAGINNFLDIDTVGDELASLAGADPAVGGGVATVTVGGTAKSVVNTLAVFARPPGDECPPAPPLGVGPFLRGDCNQDGSNTGQVTDGVFLLTFLFQGGAGPKCRAACDFNADGSVSGDVTDAVYYFNFNFLGGPPMADPLRECARSTDPEDVALGCEDPAGCT